MRQLKNEEELTADNYIAQTYTYSWENHFCEAEHLQKRFCALIPDSDFDFRLFLLKLSAVVYKPLLYLVHYSQKLELNQQWQITKFNACLPLQPKRKELTDNGRVYIERVARLFENALGELEQPKQMTIEHLNVSKCWHDIEIRCKMI